MTEPQTSASTALSPRRLLAVTIGATLALLLAALDQTIVGTAMPRIIADLNGLEYYAWVFTAYMVCSTTMVPIAGKLGDLFGRKPFMLVGMLGFITASALCGLAQHMWQLVVARGIQGVFGGMMFATVFALIADLYPPRNRARVQGLFGAVYGLASVIGPTAGGYLTDSLSWRWVFYVNLPVGIAAVAFVAAAMPTVRTKASWRDVDFAGAGTLAAGLVPLLIALSITRDHAWTSPQVLGLLAFAVVMLVVFYNIEIRNAHPIVPFSLFKNPTFAVSVVVGFLMTAGMFGTIAFVPLVFQGALGVSATDSGALFTPMMLGLIAGSLASGQLIIRVKRYRFVGTVGIALVAAAMYALSHVTVGAARADVVRDLVLLGAGLGVTMPLYVMAVQSALPIEVLGVVSSQVQFWRNMGGTVGVAVLGSILAHQLPINIRAEVDTLKLPAPIRAMVDRGASDAAGGREMFDAERVAARRAAMPAAAVPVFDNIVQAARRGLALTLNSLFRYGLAIVMLALLCSVFLDDVPLRGRTPAGGESSAQSPAPAAAMEVGG